MTARQAVTVGAMLVLLVLALWGARVGWERRRRRTLAAVPTIPAVPDELGALLAGPFDAVYVSTTLAGDWLERVVANDLGVRSPAQVSVHDTGVLVRRTGAHDVFVPRAALRGVARAPGIAGKVVGRDGLVVVSWLPPGAADDRGLDTGLLPRHAADREALVAAVAALEPQTPAAPGGNQEMP
ncbi:PH-like domain-containing protein [Cellulomonas sp. CW35]|uniref:PH-like domain-containing protein n=1 Tax=Cellulomonas sp. CW35 TaxID=3458249 RepID=UPI00403455D5